MTKKLGILHWDIENRKVKLGRLEFFGVWIYYILLPSSMVDFVPFDQLVQTAHLNDNSNASSMYSLELTPLVSSCILILSSCILFMCLVSV